LASHWLTNTVVQWCSDAVLSLSDAVLSLSDTFSATGSSVVKEWGGKPRQRSRRK